MTLRTPRRRISPRTKRKFRAIKNFFRRTLGTASQEYTYNSGSSIVASVTELKSKIDILEQQLNRVNEHCQELANFEKAFIEQPEILTKDIYKERHSQELKPVQNPDNYKSDFKTDKTEFIYRNSSKIRDSNKSFKVVKNKKHEDRNDMTSIEPTYSRNFKNVQSKPRNKKYRDSYEYFEDNNDRGNSRKKYNPIAQTYSNSNFHSLAIQGIRENVAAASSGHRKKKHHEWDYVDKRMIRRDVPNCDKRYKNREFSRKDIRKYNEVDDDFIADIIKKQYKPVKLFGKRHSDFSQFSAPVCRDNEYNIKRDIQEGSQLCSCCFDDSRRPKHRYICNSDISDMRSICDTRLYSSKRHRSRSRRYMDDYNNERLYDVIPVKEKSSPKSRRKFAEDNMLNYQCKEVPPSPRTQRPKLNLKVQNYSEFEDRRKYLKHLDTIDSKKRENYEKMFNTYQSDFSVESNKIKRLNEHWPNKSAQMYEGIETKCSVENRHFTNNQSNVFKDTTLNTQTTNLTADKTDKTLVEIKDILQSFLVEIKKETQDEKSNSTSRNRDENGNTLSEDNKKSNEGPNSGNSFNNNMGQCLVPPFLPAFPNPCCYPMMPMNVCPMNYIIPNPSLTCTACAKHSKENACLGKDCCNAKSKSSHEINTSNETQELIKEIYKFVSQNPKSNRKTVDQCNDNKFERTNIDRHKNEKKNLTNRSVGGSNKSFRHDANVGTPNMKYCSKSCEAFGSRMQSDSYYTTNTSFSDTVLEKLSLEATHSSTESDASSEIPVVKGKKCKFKKLMRSLKLFKKKKDVIEEMSEDRSIDDVHKHKPPFQQQITNYVMHGQEYFHKPPVTKHQKHFCPAHLPTHPYDHRGINDQKNVQRNEFCEHHVHCCSPISPVPYNPSNYAPVPFCSNYDPRYNQMQTPQVPLCLKEIEVKSIGTQSVRKMSIFRKFTKKVQPDQNQVDQQYSPPIPTNRLTLWKTLQDKAKQQNTDPLAFSLKTQKQLAQGDMKLRNAMLKKLFYKRNPFSPRNLIVRTLLGKDKSSFGNPPKMYKPRMFL